jgi:NADPH:quinone reductase-like Zn-dependent oxidoreductase
MATVTRKLPVKQPRCQLTAITAWELPFDRLDVPHGVKTQKDTILAVNGAGGVGSILTQLARRLTGFVCDRHGLPARHDRLVEGNGCS